MASTGMLWKHLWSTHNELIPNRVKEGIDNEQIITWHLNVMGILQQQSNLVELTSTQEHHAS